MTEKTTTTTKKSKMFAVRDKTTGEISRLVRAEKKGDVIKHLVAAYAVEEANAVDATELVMNGMHVETAAGNAKSAAENGEDAASAAGDEA